MGSLANTSGGPILLKTPDAFPFQLSNCSDILPYSETFFSVITTQELAAISVAGVLVLAVVVMYIESVHFVLKHFQLNVTVRNLSLWMLGLHPVFALTAIIAVCIPRSALISDLVATIYLSLCLRMFLILMIHYHGGEDALITRMEGDIINMRSPPLCCCFCCCPKLPVNSRNLHRIRLSVWQVAILRPFLVFMAAVMWTDGKYIKGKMKWNQAYLYLAVLTIISTLIAMYGLVMFYRASRKHLRKLNIIPKFICLQLVLVFSNLQGFVFTILATNNLPPCKGILSTSARGDALNHLILIGEMFLLALLARCYYRRKDGAYTLDELTISPPDSEEKDSDSGTVCFKKKDKYGVSQKENTEGITAPQVIDTEEYSTQAAR